jgi:hypothetical protein
MEAPLKFDIYRNIVPANKGACLGSSLPLHRGHGLDLLYYFHVLQPPRRPAFRLLNESFQLQTIDLDMLTSPQSR